MYFASNDPKASAFIKSAVIDIPIKYYDIFKKILPHSDIYFPKNILKKGITTFTIKKLY